MSQIQAIGSNPADFVNRRDQTVHPLLLGIESAMHRIVDDVEHTALADRCNRRAAGQRLDRGDTEILHPRLKEAEGAAVEIAQALWLHPAQEPGLRAGEPRQALLLGAFADNIER